MLVLGRQGDVGRRPVVMVDVGLDLSRTRLDVHVMDEAGTRLAVTTAVPDRGGLAVLADRIGGFGGQVYAAIESMNGTRFVHDQLELAGWQVEIADARKVKGLAPPTGKTDKIDAWVFGRAVAPRPGPGHLAAHSDGARRTRTSPLAAALGPPPHRAEEPHPPHPARLRPPLPGVRPVRRRRQGAAGSAGTARAVGRRYDRSTAADRPSRRGDHRW